MADPKVSVLMPAYNAEKYIGEAIESILNQTFKDFEFIIIDDGSTDKTGEIIQKYAKEDKRIIAFQNGKNLGISPTRNKLVSLAKGKYIVWQDADDISMPYRIEHQFDFMEKNPEVGIAGGYLQFFDENGLRSIRKYARDDKSLRRKIFRYSPVAQPAAIIRKKILEHGPFPNIEAAEDLAVSLQIGMNNKFANLQEVLIKYRENKEGVTFKKLRQMELATLRLRFYYAKIGGLKMSLLDRVYCCTQYLSIYFLPTKLKIAVFNFLRNS